ncbi:lipid IV(A) 3-deoxy-D-manno-octulosonic acid transferase [Marinobacterium jannaschii]|uniref:lipid IV(A) 3-deoxy-D-manno-octulosonic acid transferase n=1 Tax=Marinobacterium jannaschii TaxID=64970 RepID=UPI0004827822|nr:lipid IV(A) 3-deoxy-D-manno-octulosonic acid transferase [Marinobacterium jannaschii]
MRWLYSCAWYLALPLVLVRLYLRSRKAPAYAERVSERFGLAPKISGQPLWIHAVSVGETVAIAPLVELLLKRHPELPVLVTTMTPTGAERVRSIFGDRVLHCYCPYDHPWLVSLFLRRTDPRALVVVETELWPNIVSGCHTRAIPVVLANARLSERSARGYAKFSSLTRPMLQQLTLVAAQNRVAADRFLQLGLPENRLQVTGSIKFDISPADDLVAKAFQLKAEWGARPVIVAGSTHDGEEQMLLEILPALQQLEPDLLLVIVPRHPERFGPVAELCSSKGFQVVSRSSGAEVRSSTAVYIGDTMGELLLLFAAADIAFVGGSLIERGGHNPLEPAVLAKPVVMGPHVFNFAEICSELELSGGLQLAESGDGLQRCLVDLMANPERALEQGRKAAAFVKQNQGALERLYSLIEEHGNIS